MSSAPQWYNRTAHITAYAQDYQTTGGTRVLNGIKNNQYEYTAKAVEKSTYGVTETAGGETRGTQLITRPALRLEAGVASSSTMVTDMDYVTVASQNVLTTRQVDYATDTKTYTFYEDGLGNLGFGGRLTTSGTRTYRYIQNSVTGTELGESYAVVVHETVSSWTAFGTNATTTYKTTVRVPKVITEERLVVRTKYTEQYILADTETVDAVINYKRSIAVHSVRGKAYAKSIDAYHSVEEGSVVGGQYKANNYIKKSEKISIDEEGVGFYEVTTPFFRGITVNSTRQKTYYVEGATKTTPNTKTTFIDYTKVTTNITAPILFSSREPITVSSTQLEYKKERYELPITQFQNPIKMTRRDNDSIYPLKVSTDTTRLSTDYNRYVVSRLTEESTTSIKTEIQSDIYSAVTEETTVLASTITETDNIHLPSAFFENTNYAFPNGLGTYQAKADCYIALPGNKSITDIDGKLYKILAKRIIYDSPQSSKETLHVADIDEKLIETQETISYDYKSVTIPSKTTTNTGNTQTTYNRRYKDFLFTDNTDVPQPVVSRESFVYYTQGDGNILKSRIDANFGIYKHSYTKFLAGDNEIIEYLDYMSFDATKTVISDQTGDNRAHITFNGDFEISRSDYNGTELSFVEYPFVGIDRKTCVISNTVLSPNRGDQYGDLKVGCTVRTTFGAYVDFFRTQELSLLNYRHFLNSNFSVLGHYAYHKRHSLTAEYTVNNGGFKIYDEERQLRDKTVDYTNGEPLMAPLKFFGENDNATYLDMGKYASTFIYSYTNTYTTLTRESYETFFTIPDQSYETITLTDGNTSANTIILPDKSITYRAYTNNETTSTSSNYINSNNIPTGFTYIKHNGKYYKRVIQLGKPFYSTINLTKWNAVEDATLYHWHKPDTRFPLKDDLVTVGSLLNKVAHHEIPTKETITLWDGNTSGNATELPIAAISSIQIDWETRRSSQTKFNNNWNDKATSEETKYLISDKDFYSVKAQDLYCSVVPKGAKFVNNVPMVIETANEYAEGIKTFKIPHGQISYKDYVWESINMINNRYTYVAPMDNVLLREMILEFHTTNETSYDGLEAFYSSFAREEIAGFNEMYDININY